MLSEVAGSFRTVSNFWTGLKFHSIITVSTRVHLGMRHRLSFLLRDFANILEVK